ncbi:MAG: hypothetical protein JHC35_00880 [Sulfuricurvum sp.]|jgi:hypothetical protein|uniref:hypothetical protein n=1 Tax=Sulfuricurvum sp. TaxID=2025608 RepID=UPI0025DAF6DF|nr:hypothetical protein [Sulfuricurvum sp.]MCI4405820.1 hypothetical protein [Sulfuricurvum sp.]
MDSISSNVSSGLEIYAMKKALEIQGQGIMKVLESASPTPNVSGSELTGLGQNLDTKA